VDPQFYGLGAYGVVETADLPPEPEIAVDETAPAVPLEAAPPGTLPSKYGAVPQEVDELPAPGLSPTRHRVRTGTVPLPDPDEYEPL
jgi:hypothetical protein